MISCRNVAALLNSGGLPAQPWWKRMEVRLHLAMCGLCSRLAKQLQQLRAAARQSRDQNEADAEFEERVTRRLSQG